MTPDTSAEAVERRIRELQEAGFDNAAATLRALSAERDAAKADLFACVKQVSAEGRLRGTAEAERDALAAERDRLAAEVASLRLTLGGKTFSAEVPEPIGCPLPGACATVAEIVRGREVQAAWLRVIQAENTCGVTGKSCDAVRCGCAAEQEMLIREATEAAQEPQHDR